MAHLAKILWKKRKDETFVDNKYSRAHTWSFDGGIEITASSSPHVVPLPLSIEDAVDPEEAFVASLSSCHMLWFLSIAAGKKILVERYEDNAEGIMAKDAEGKLAMTEVMLKPKVTFGSSVTPTSSQINELHHLAHEKCYIANSVKTKITIAQI
ncbi:MAG: OsmC family protein [Bacteroidota bacterium]|nr:OsmC family protein [Bacteroidota bacterium]